MSAVPKFQHKWELGLKVVEDAMLTMPKAISHHLIKHKLMFKSRLGKNMEGDIMMFSVSCIPVIHKDIHSTLQERGWLVRLWVQLLHTQIYKKCTQFSVLALKC